MTAQYTPAQIEHFKVVAKRASRQSGSTHTSALNELAVSKGFKNWQMLMRATAAAQPASGFKPFVLTRDDDGWRAAVQNVPGANVNNPSDFAALHSIAGVFGSPSEAVGFAQAYMRDLLARPRFTVGPHSLVVAEMYWWLPYVVRETEDGTGVRMLLNRHYGPVGLADRATVDDGSYANLRVDCGLDSLRAFSDGSGYLYGVGPDPWQGKKAAVRYLDRLDALAAVCSTPAASDTTWGPEHQEIYLALASWAGVFTWFTGHGSDERRLDEVIARLRAWSVPPTVGQLNTALQRHRNENPEMLGGKATARDVEKYARRIGERLRQAPM